MVRIIASFMSNIGGDIQCLFLGNESIMVEIIDKRVFDDIIPFDCTGVNLGLMSEKLDDLRIIGMISPE